MGERPYRERKSWELKFCQTCNANSRVIVRGKCIVCGNDPTVRATNPPDRTTDPPTPVVTDWGFRDEGQWAWWEFVILSGLIVATLYVLWQVARWPI